MDGFELEQIENTHYSENVKYAVRYGYHYRLEAEEQTENDIFFHCKLYEASPFLYWLANMVICGIAYDVIKKMAFLLLQKLRQKKVNTSKELKKILVNEEELKRFVRYVDEFNSKNLGTTEKETSYIREEIIADYVGAKAGEIYEKYKRYPNRMEMKSITRDANSLADKLLKNADETDY